MRDHAVVKGLQRQAAGLQFGSCALLREGQSSTRAAAHGRPLSVAFRCLGRFQDGGHEIQTSRAAALDLVTAAIILFNCRYLGRAVDAMRRRGTSFDERIIPQLSPLGWDHINITGD